MSMGDIVSIIAVVIIELSLFIGYKISTYFLDSKLADIVGIYAIAINGILLILFGFIYPIVTGYDEQQNIETTIKENHKNCDFIEDNQFYSDGKLYQYRLDNSESKVIITCKDDNEKEVNCFKLDD